MPTTPKIDWTTENEFFPELAVMNNAIEEYTMEMITHHHITELKGNTGSSQLATKLQPNYSNEQCH